MEGSISEPDVLSKRLKFAYSVGHVLNDATSSMWFSYILLFYYRVVNFTNASAGYLLLIGQITDALTTIFVSLASDRTRTGLFHYGRRKTWHLIGVISILISFPFCFNLCIGCKNSKLWAQFIYYTVFIIIFQFGWACSYVTHLAMINELTHKDGERVALNSYRHAWAFISNIFVYVMASVLLGFSSSLSESSITSADAPIFRKLTFIVVGFSLICMIIFHVGLKESNQITEQTENRSQLTSTSSRILKRMTWKQFLHGERVALNSYRHAWAFISNIFVYVMASVLLGFSSSLSESSITSADAPIFRKLTFIVVGFSLICMIIFHVGLKESNQITEQTENRSQLTSTSSRILKRMTWKQFLREKEFYQCTFIWVAARVIFHVTQVFLPLYTIDTILTLDRVFVAIAPLCICFGGLVTSFPMRSINKRLGRNLTNIIGYGLALASMILFWFIVDLKSKLQIEIALISACILFGMATSATSICSTALASDFIGLNTECGAFIYGVMSFIDKLVSGIIITIVQQFNPCKLSSTHKCALYYRYIVTFIPAGIAILAIFMILSIWKTNIGSNRYEIIQEAQNDIEMKIKVANKNEHNERSPLVD
ncbi:unnamed protein product [Rotaria sp. Silwood1]|nr:unnamed protein product [Rotaria sp. Silwood1]